MLKSLHQFQSLEKPVYGINYGSVGFLMNTYQEENLIDRLKAAKENVKNILSVSDLARQAQEHIDSNRLLEAHQCLLDMETCRNEILEEIGVGLFLSVLE